jgi:hypothetical protein
MKVFVCGSCYVRNDVGKWTLPDVVCTYLDELMAEETEILVDDRSIVAAVVQNYLKTSEYKKVSVYVAGGKNWTELNLGKWDENHSCVHGWGSTIYSRDIERDFNMIENADTGFAIWDGNDFNTYANMLCLCVLGKPVKLYLISEDRWIDVNSIGDLSEFKGPNEELSEDEIYEVMTCCKVSKETMKSVVMEDDEYVYQILVDCINQADIEFKKKLELLSLLTAKQNLKYEVFYAVERAVRLGKSWKTIKHDVRAIADFRPVGYEKAEIPWKEIWQNWYEIDKIVNPRKYVRYFVFGNKKITLE